MNTTHTNKNFDKISLDWKLIQSELKLKLGIEVYESWIKKINFVEEFNNYVLLSVPTRFILSKFLFVCVLFIFTERLQLHQ